MKEENSPEYLRMNPKGRVPTLVTERGILTETPAILEFICQTYPAADLAPLDDTFELARAVELLPGLNITEVLTLIPMRDNEVTERYARLLSEAGLPD